MSRILNVLLIEDDQLVQYAMVEALADAGHVVSVAGTLARAMDVLTHPHYFDVVLLDLRLGKKHNKNNNQQQKTHKKPFPPVIIVSAQPVPEIQRVEELIEAAGSLQKPVSIADICVAMESAAH